MNDFLRKYIGLYNEESADQGSGGGGGSSSDAPPAASKNTTTGSDFEGAGKELGTPFQQTETNIRNKTNNITSQNDSESDDIGAFDRSEEQPRPPQGDKGESAPKSKQTGEEPAGDKAGQEGDQNEPDKFYDPDSHAEGRDVYPNSYDNRADAVDAIAAKLSYFEEQADKLGEMDSDIGAVIDPELREKIDQYSDLNSIGEADNEQIRNFIADIDEGLKAVGQKVEKVEKRYNTKQQTQQVSQEYKEATKAGQDAVKTLDFADKLAELNNTPGAQVDDVMEAVDETIESELSDINKEIEKHENNEDFVMDNGQQAYIQKLRDLEQKRDERKQELMESKQSLKDWFDAKDSYQKMQQQPEAMSKQERLERSDQVFEGYLEDRVMSPNAPDFFKQQSPNTIKALRQFGFAPANFEKYDLTTKDGWIKAEKDFVKFRDKQIAKQQANNMNGDNKGKREDKSDKYGPIPTPDRQGMNMPSQANYGSDELQEVENNISRLSKKLSRSGSTDAFNNSY